MLDENRKGLVVAKVVVILAEVTASLFVKWRWSVSRKDRAEEQNRNMKGIGKRTSGLAQYFILSRERRRKGIEEEGKKKKKILMV